MKLLTVDMYRQKRLEKKARNNIASKRIESKLKLELKEKLDDYLRENDSVMFEVNNSVLGEFMNVISTGLDSLYDFEQLDANKFVFHNKEINI